MGPFSAGQVVFLPFPFSDLSRRKLRPVLLIASVGEEDWIVCQITSNPYADRHAIMLSPEDFAVGELQRVSFARPGKLFTAHMSLVASCPGRLRSSTLEQVRDAVVAIIRGVAVRW